MMYGQMTAGSWIYIGTQGILQGTYETFAELARQHFGGTLRGRVVLTAGLGGMGGAQPLAVTMNDGVALCHRGRPVARRAAPGDALPRPLDRRPRRGPAMGARGGRRRDAALDRARRQRGRGRTRAGPARRALRCRHRPDLRARRPQRLRAGRTLARGCRRAARQRPGRLHAPGHRVDGHARPSHARAAGSRRRRLRLRQQHPRPGPGGRGRERLRLPGLRAGLHPAALLRGQGALPLGRAVGRPGRHPRPPTRPSCELFPEDEALARWIRKAQEQVAFQGLPARICWLGYGERHRAGLAFNELVRSGVVSAPIVIGRDHLDAGSVASPNRETEAMRDGSDAVADWPLLNAMVNTAAGASWVSIHHGGGVGIGYSQHAGMVVVADGTDLAAQKLERVLTTRPRHGRRAPCRRRLRAGHRGRARTRRARPHAGRVMARRPCRPQRRRAVGPRRRVGRTRRTLRGARRRSAAAGGGGTCGHRAAGGLRRGRLRRDHRIRLAGLDVRATGAGS